METGAPAVETEQMGGAGWGEMSRAREADSDERWVLLIRPGEIWQLYGLREENIDKFPLFLSLSVSVRYCFRGRSG